MRRLAFAVVIVVILMALVPASVPDARSQRPGPASAGPVVATSELKEMRWRMIGPHRAGRGKAAVGIPDRPNVFFIGFHNGGVWKTTDYGRTWVPIFDDQPTGSIGAIAIAPSNPDIIYVGSGEGNQRPDLATGDGIYRTSDGGKTWTHHGLRDAQQIPQIIVDPRNPDRIFVAALGHPYGANPERGIFRSTDGGRSFEKVLYKDENTGAADVAFDPKNADVVYATLWESRQAPWENGVFTGPGSGLYKSIDGGTTWRPIGNGLPAGTDGLGRIGLGMCDAQPSRIYAVIASPPKLGGVYRSDDGGENWRRVNDDNRLWGREGDFHEIKPDPTNCDVLYVANIASWKSTDGGKTFTDFRGAPGGDDYQRIWVNPKNTDIIIMIADQGAVITVNGGETWSSWYNQPTAQFYHVSTDNAFPYRVCGGQQESGSACVSSRGDDGQVTFREWHPVGVEEYGYVAADPLDPDIVYGGKVSRYDRRTGQVQSIGPWPPGSAPGPARSGSGRRLHESVPYRVVRTMPVLFSPIDPKTLYFASNVVWKTTTGGKSWTQISPDLTRATWDVPRNVGKYIGTEAAKPTQRGVVYTIAPSPLDINRIWAGTDDGLIHVTIDGGKTWTDVTPPEVTPWAKVSLMDASRFDARTAYAAINTFRLDDLKPHIYRTRDGGESWTHITNGIPDGGIVNAVREDPKRRGLLYAGTEQAVYVSFNDGENWQSLRLNMPATSIRDLVIKDDDLVVGTHGRSFWILDDISPLREMGTAKGAGPFLYTPAQAWRVRWNKNTDTPLPPDEPAGENPPDGAILNYWLPADARDVTLDIVDAGGSVVRKYASSDALFDPNAERVNFPRYWIRPPQRLSAAGGFHRFVWDVHYPPPRPTQSSYPIAAIHRNTPRQPQGPWAPPGSYTVRLTVDGAAQTRPLLVKVDPRVKTSTVDLGRQFTLSKQLYDAINALDEGQAQRRGQLLQLYGIIQGADVGPTSQVEAAVKELLAQARSSKDEG